MENRISFLSRFLLVVAASLLVVSIFVPIWRIELDAPQYPEGLMLQIYSNKLGGQVEIINGLNHYIGMQTLHAENFIEFTILPYIIGFYALLCLVAAVVAKRKFVNFVLGAFVVFGVVAMVDFWRWEYNYGHNLDPNAAIIVPGMAYQPPLIGFKQLLNFGAYSIPDLGGWLFIGAGLLLLVVVWTEWKKFKKIKLSSKIRSMSMLLMVSCGLMSCGNLEADPLIINRDRCAFCEMTISDGSFGCELISDKGRVYKFDDIFCLKEFEKSKPEMNFAGYYINDHSKDNVLIPAKEALYIKHKDLKSPMGGNIAAFSTNEDALKLSNQLGVPVMTWNELPN